MPFNSSTVYYRKHAPPSSHGSGGNRVGGPSSIPSIPARARSTSNLIKAKPMSMVDRQLEHTQRAFRIQQARSLRAVCGNPQKTAQVVKATMARTAGRLPAARRPRSAAATSSSVPRARLAKSGGDLKLPMTSRVLSGTRTAVFSRPTEIPGYTGFVKGSQLVAGRSFGRVTARARKKEPVHLVRSELVPASPQCAPKLQVSDSYGGMVPGYCGFVPTIRDTVGLTYGSATTAAPYSAEGGLVQKKGRKALLKHMWVQ